MSEDKNIKNISLKKIFRGASIYSLGEVLVKASGFFLIPLYTRILSPTEYGIVGYLQVFMQVLVVIFGFGFNGSQTRFYFENINNIFKIGRFSFTINLFLLFIAIIIGIPISILGSYYDWKIGNSNISFNPYFLLIIWAVFSQIFSNNAVAFYRAKQNFIIASLLQLSRFIFINTFTVIFIIKYNMGALGQIAGILLGTLIFMIISFIGYSKIFIFKPSINYIKYSFSYGLPIVIHLLAGTIHNVIDRIILEKFVDLETVGIYTLGFTIGSALNIFIISFNQAYQPSYFKLMGSETVNKENSIIKIFKIWLRLITIISALGIIFGAPFLKIFAGKEFIETINIFPWIILAIYLGSFYYFFSSPIFYFKKTLFLPIITITSALINIVLNIILIPKLGMFGAAYSTIISHIVQSLLAYIIGNRLYKIIWPLKQILISSLIISCTVIIQSIIKN